MTNTESKALLLDRQLVQIMHQIAGYLDADRATLFLHDPDEDELCSKVATGKEISEIRVKADQGIAGLVWQTGKLVNIPDAYADDRFNPKVDKQSGYKTRSILCRPVIDLENRAIGVVQVLNKRNGAFNEHDERLLEAVSNQAAIAIENAQLYERVTKLRQTEADLKQELEVNHRQLQDAFTVIESSKRELEDQLAGRIWNRRLLASVGGVVGLLLVIMVFTLSDFDLQADSQVQDTLDVDSAVFDEFVTKTEPVYEHVTVIGVLAPLEWIEVTSPLDSILTESHFEFGEHVDRGQLLAELDTAKHLAAFRDAQAAQITALRNYENIRNWQSGIEVTRTKRDLNRARNEVNRGRAELEAAHRLFDRGIISQKELESEVNTLTNLEGALLAAEENLEAVLIQGSEEQVRIARLALDNAQQTLADIAARLDRATITSPADGIIFPSQKNEKKDEPKILAVGNTISQDQSMFAIANMQGLSLEAEVSEEEVLILKRGDKAELHIDALEGISLVGEISYIANRATTNHGESLFAIRISVTEVSDDVREAVRIGMSATAVVEIYAEPDGIVVPFDAVVFHDGDYYVRTRNQDGEPSLKPVDVRSTLRDGIHVVGGLSPGDIILVPSQSG